MAEKETLVLVDGSSLAFRAFYALMRTGMKTKDGVPSWAIHGFFSSLFDQIERQKPDMIVVCFDLPQPTFRHEKYEQYKANRKEMPDELAVQWPLIKEGVKTFEIPLLEIPGFEADDLIGTLAKSGEAQGYKVIVLTGDRDAFQLVDGEDTSIEIHLTTKDGLINCGRQEVFERMGVWPEQIVDFKALCGDSSDNIPGVKGIGEKGAQQLLGTYQSLDGVYEHLEEIKSAALKKKLVEGKEMAYTSQHLATIRLDVPVDFDFAHAKLTPPQESKIRQYFDALNFRQLTGRLGKVLNRFNVALTAEEQLRHPPQPQAVETGALGQLLLFPSLAQPRQNESPKQPLPKPVIIQDLAGLEEMLAHLCQQQVIAIDLETTGLQALNTQIVGWALACDDKVGLTEKGHLQVSPRSFCGESLKTYYIPVGHQDGSQQLATELVATKLKALLEDKKIGKIAQNGKFEMNILSRHGINLEPICFDPMLASYIENPDQKHGLKDQALRVFDYQMVRIEELIGSGRKQLTMDMVPLEKVAPYAGDDARLTLELACHYAARFDEEQLFLLHDMELPLQAVLARIEQNGVALDTRYLKEFSKELSTQLNSLESEIYELAGHIFNIASTQQLQKVLFEELALKTKHKTKTGFSTDAAVLEALKDDHPIIAKILDYRQIAKLRSTYVDALPNAILPHDGRLHGEFNQTITSTGRLSSSNPNLQNIPIRTQLGRQIRRAFIAGNADSSLISADYSQIELRLLADMSEDETLLDAFEKNQDIHARTAGEIFDLPLEQVSSDMRRVGKTLNFALVYQQGAYSTAQDLGISPKEAQLFIDKYFSRYPKVQGFLQSTIAQARASGYAKTLWGRRRYFNHLEDRNDNIRKADERAACNAPIQGSAADLIKLAMVSLDKELRQAKSGAKLILQVHDELVLEVPDNEMEETKALIDAAMTSSQKLKVPLRVDMGTGKNWMDCK
jgi:DNA polymerase-1